MQTTQKTEVVIYVTNKTPLHAYAEKLTRMKAEIVITDHIYRHDNVRNDIRY